MEYCGRVEDDTRWGKCEHAPHSDVCYFHSIACEKPALPSLAPTEVGLVGWGTSRMQLPHSA
jgi:hypothetical protein